MDYCTPQLTYSVEPILSLNPLLSDIATTFSTAPQRLYGHGHTAGEIDRERNKKRDVLSPMTPSHKKKN